MKVRTFLAFGMSVLAALLCQAEIGIGDLKDEVIRQYGKPTSTARRGENEILIYPQGGRVVLVDGKVTDVKGPLPVLTPASVKPATADTPAAESRTIAPAAPTPPQVTTSPPRRATVPAGEDYNPAAGANELAKHVEKMDTAWGMAPPKQELHSPLDSIPLFLAGLLLRFILTILALKLAFKYWEMDAFWTGILSIAAIDMVLHAGFELLGPASGGFTTLMAVENGIPTLVMIYTVNRFCFNKRIQNAVVTAVAVKVLVTLLYIFAGVAMLSILFR